MSTSDSRLWDLGGLSDDGGLERPLGAPEWHRPAHVYLTVTSYDPDEDGRIEEDLAWGEVDAHGQRGPFIRSGPGMLEQFVALGDAPATTIVEYARRWGVLRLCHHGVPAAHNQPSGPFEYALLTMESRCEPQRVVRLSDQTTYFIEPIAAWRSHARRARAILNIAATLNGGRLGTIEDWRRITDSDEQSDIVDLLPTTIDGQKRILAFQVSRWLEYGGVRPRIEWKDGQLTIELAGGELFGALGIQLMLAITSSKMFAFCLNCGIAYIPKRRPAAGRRCYCPDCAAAGAAVRDATRDYTARKKARAR